MSELQFFGWFSVSPAPGKQSPEATGVTPSQQGALWAFPRPPAPRRVSESSWPSGPRNVARCTWRNPARSSAGEADRSAAGGGRGGGGKKSGDPERDGEKRVHPLDPPRPRSRQTDQTQNRPDHTHTLPMVATDPRGSTFTQLYLDWRKRTPFDS